MPPILSKRRFIYAGLVALGLASLGALLLRPLAAAPASQCDGIGMSMPFSFQQFKASSRDDSLFIERADGGGAGRIRLHAWWQSPADADFLRFRYQAFTDSVQIQIEENEQCTSQITLANEGYRLDDGFSERISRRLAFLFVLPFGVLWVFRRWRWREPVFIGLALLIWPVLPTLF